MGKNSNAPLVAWLSPKDGYCVNYKLTEFASTETITER